MYKHVHTFPVLLLTYKYYTICIKLYSKMNPMIYSFLKHTYTSYTAFKEDFQFCFQQWWFDISDG